MRVISFLLFTLFVHSSCKNSSANIDLQDDKEVHKALSNKWEATYMETTGARVKVPEQQATSILFEENGTFSSGVKNGVIVNKGEWTYNPMTHILNMGTRKDKSPARVLKLTGRELILAEYMLANEEIVDSTVVTYEKP